MQAVASARDGARLAVEALGPCVRQPRAHVRDDAVEVRADGLGEATERCELRPGGPPDPFAEFAARDMDLLAVEDRGERLLEQVGADQAPVGPGQRRQLADLEVPEVPRTLEQRPAGALPRLAGGARRRGVDLGAPHLVERVLGEALDVEPVEHDLRLGRGLGHGLDVRGGHVDGHGFELGDAGRAELGEQGRERRGILALVSPHDPTRDVIDDDRDVLVVAAVRELVDPDVRQPVEQVARRAPCPDPLDEVADGRPGDPHQLAHGRLVAPLGEVARVVLERPREPRADVGPRQVLDRHATPRAVDPPGAVPQVELHAREVQVAPAPVALPVVARAVVAAARAAGPAPRRRHVHQQPIVHERDIDHAGVFQPEQFAE